MKLYPLLRKWLFALPPEHAHKLSLNLLNLAYRFKVVSKKKFDAPCKVMGLTFPNPVGLAAGYDKNGEYIHALSALGFGFIEIGTVTPKAQSGNPAPRLFRLESDEAIINRLGFNNKGMDYVATQLEKNKFNGILGINIGKNADTAIEEAHRDYVVCFERLWRYASYITINVSSPNTKGLRDLQSHELLTQLVSVLKDAQKKVQDTHHKYVPLVLKISPDLSFEALSDLAKIITMHHVDGVIATNTTIEREELQHSFAQEAGGLSGKPLATKSTQVLRQLNQLLENKIPIIASGGIVDDNVAKEKWQAGASLLQLYTGLVYQGPDLIEKCLPK